VSAPSIVVVTACRQRGPVRRPSRHWRLAVFTACCGSLTLAQSQVVAERSRTPLAQRGNRRTCRAGRTTRDAKRTTGPKRDQPPRTGGG